MGSDTVRTALDEILGQMPDLFNMTELAERLEDDRTPGQHVFYQECERMNALLAVVTTSLRELDQGLSGALAMSAAMHTVFEAIVLDQIPDHWLAVSFASIRPLGAWVRSLMDRHQQLAEWTGDLSLPKVVMLNYMFNPNSFLTAVVQTSAMVNNYDLDQMALVVDVTKKWPDQIDAPAREGAYVSGLYLEGARWDIPNGVLEESRLKELHPKMPVVTIRALPSARVDTRDMYLCPVYTTVERGPTFVSTFPLKTKYNANKWVIAGVALILDVTD